MKRLSREAQERQRRLTDAEAEAETKKHAQEEQDERERAVKVKAFRERFKTEILANARLKILCHLQNRVGEAVDLCADKAGNLYGVGDGPALKKIMFEITPNGVFIQCL